MQLPANVWVPVAQIPKDTASAVYTLVITSGNPTFEISADGGVSSVSLPEAAVGAGAAIDLILAREISIRASASGAQLV